MDLSGSIALLGRPSNDPAVRSLLTLLRIAREPAVTIDDKDENRIVSEQDWLINRGLGVELGFETRAHLLGDELDDPEAPLLLSQIYFYCRHDGVEPYGGHLPFGLSPGDDRDAARAKLAPHEATRRSYLRDTWEPPECRLTVSYSAGAPGIGFVLCLLRAPAMPADAEDAALVPAIRQIGAVLGKPLSDPELRLTFAPLRLEQNLADDSAGLVANFTRHAGLELQFRQLAGGRALALTNVIFYREHEVEGARWPGGLPLDLTFEDSPDELRRKVGRAPDQTQDEAFIGYAIWHLSGCTLQVKYSTMENFILRVQLAAPGAWKDEAA
jgi:hypothetical protein